ncbi:MAG: GDSL-type esterase/lipase family protein [Candidatus Nomurabacteria bacterium]|jgi:lysophospholipase L1-like esterase|nr:GDSL-type esterase/lipase family protein [Candidatus Nomurabacteria bacterium]
MKNASAKKAHKRQRSKHKIGRQKQTRIETIAVLVALCLALVATATVITVDILKISIIKVGLPVVGGVYKIQPSDVLGQDFLEWDFATDSDYAQRYQIDYNSSEEYTIRQVYSNLLLSGVIDTKTRQLTYELRPADGSCAQSWLMTYEPSGSRLVSTCDVWAESRILRFQSVGGGLELPAPAKPVVENGVYAFSPNSNPQGVVETISDRPQVVEKDNSPQQLFELTYTSLGYYNIYSLDLEQYLDISADGDLSLSVQPAEYCGQSWAITFQDAAYKIISSCNGQVLGALDGVNVGTVSSVDDVSALWQIEPRRTLLFVGDSITYGQTNCNYGSSYCRRAASNAVDVEMSILNREAVNYIEINMGNSGATASSYLYGINEAYLQKLRKYRIEIAQIMLGTNDATRGFSVAAYLKNLTGIINELQTAGVKTIIINRPIYNAVSAWQLSNYFEGLTGLANNQTIFIGDTAGYDWFRQNSWHLDGGGSGFHPDTEGYRVLGELWAAAFQQIVEN